MGVFDKAKKFLKANKSGAIIGGIVGFGMGSWQMLNYAWLNQLAVPALFGISGTISVVLNIAWFVFIGAGAEWLLRKKLKLF